MRCKVKMGFTKQQVKEIEVAVVRALTTEEFAAALRVAVSEAVKTAMAEITRKVEQVIEDFSRFKNESKQATKECILRCAELEQYGRRNNLRVFGVPEVRQENCEGRFLRRLCKVGLEFSCLSMR